MSTDNATSTEAKSGNKSADQGIFFTGRNDTGPAVSIRINESTAKGAPKFVGNIGDKKVGGYIRNGSRGPFIGFVGDRLEDGTYPQVAFGNIIVNKNANIRLQLRMDGAAEPIWAMVDKSADQDLLVQCGLSLEILEAKRAALQNAG